MQVRRIMWLVDKMIEHEVIDNQDGATAFNHIVESRNKLPRN